MVAQAVASAKNTAPLCARSLTDLIRKASTLHTALLLVCSATSAVALAQTDTPMTPLQKQIHRLDLGIAGVGMYNTTVSGPVSSPVANQGTGTVTQYGSSTVGELGELRYIVSPYIGFQFNYGNARYTEHYSVAPTEVQAKVNEYTLGYIALPPHEIFGLQPYVGAGAGTTAFKPTAFGGQGAPEQARATYYYTLGVQKYMDDAQHFGLRAGFRQAFFLAPDFGQNYLTILKHTSTLEPQIGFYVRY